MRDLINSSIVINNSSFFEVQTEHAVGIAGSLGTDGRVHVRQLQGHVLLFNCVSLALGRLLDFSEPQFPYL